MTFGQKLKKLRTENNLTQKDLADQLHVTFQTVSKWENDTNEPDLATLKDLTKILNCSLETLLSTEDEEVLNDAIVEQSVFADNPSEENHVELHKCSRCGKEIPQDELAFANTVRRVRHGRRTSTVPTGKVYYHKSCLEEANKERALLDKKIKAEKAKKSRKLCFGWGIAAGVVGFGIALAIFLCNTQYVHPALGVLFSLLIGYAMFAMLYCIISGSYIGDVFVWAAGLSVKFPGLIFTWDLEGVAWLIAMKIMFAVLGFLIGVFALMFAIALSASLGSISFPFVLIHNIHTNYEDAF